MECKEIMTKNPVCLTPQDTVDKAAQLMKGEDVGTIPIVKDLQSKKVAGIVTDRDIVLKVVAENQNAKTTHLEDIMSRNPFTCRPQDDVEDAREAMAAHQVRRIMVVDDDDRLLGIIAQKDIATRMGNDQETGETVKEISKD